MIYALLKWGPIIYPTELKRGVGGDSRRQSVLHGPRRARYSKTCVKRQFSKRPKIGIQAYLSLIAGQKYCRMLQGKHFAILSTFIKLPFVIKIFVSSILSGRFTQV